MNFGVPWECCSVTYEDFDYFASMLARIVQGCYIAKADYRVSVSDYTNTSFGLSFARFYD